MLSDSSGESQRCELCVSCAQQDHIFVCDGLGKEKATGPEGRPGAFVSMSSWSLDNLLCEEGWGRNGGVGL